MKKNKEQSKPDRNLTSETTLSQFLPFVDRAQPLFATEIRIDGRTELILTPLELLDRLAHLVTPVPTPSSTSKCNTSG